MQRVVRRHEHGHDRFAELFGVIDDRGQQVLIVDVQPWSDMLVSPPGSSTLAVMTTTSVVVGSVSARALSSMNRLCGERIATSLRYGLVRPRLSAVMTWTGAIDVELLDVLVMSRRRGVGDGCAP